VHNYFTNFRKMPYTAEQKQWVAKREEERARLKTGLSTVNLNDKKNQPSGKDKKGKGKESESFSSHTEAPRPPKYSSAHDFMETHFPSFENKVDTHGILRQHQVHECERIYDLLSECLPGQSMKAIERGLITPQDRPLPVCLENLKDALEGLMENPLPKEEWRVYPKESTGGGKKKKSKKKEAA
jgi:hypothetical protein